MLIPMASRWCMLLTACLACGGGLEPDGGTEPLDAGADGGASTTDGGPLNDGSLVDASAEDAAPPEPDAGPPDPSVTLGTGQLDFEPLPSDGTLELVRGGQGGVHLTVAARIVGVEPDATVIRYFGYQADGGLRIFLPTSRSLDPTDVLDVGDAYVRANDRLILDETRVDQLSIVGMQIRIEVTLEAPDGLLTDSAVVTVVDEI